MIITEFCNMLKSLQLVEQLTIEDPKIGDDKSFNGQIIQAIKEMQSGDFLEYFSWCCSDQSFTSSTLPIARALLDLPRLLQVTVRVSEKDRK